MATLSATQTVLTPPYTGAGGSYTLGSNTITTAILTVGFSQTYTAGLYTYKLCELTLSGPAVTASSWSNTISPGAILSGTVASYGALNAGTATCVVSSPPVASLFFPQITGITGTVSGSLTNYTNSVASQPGAALTLSNFTSVTSTYGLTNTSDNRVICAGQQIVSSVVNAAAGLCTTSGSAAYVWFAAGSNLLAISCLTNPTNGTSGTYTFLPAAKLLFWTSYLTANSVGPTDYAGNAGNSGRQSIVSTTTPLTVTSQFTSSSISASSRLASTANNFVPKNIYAIVTPQLITNIPVSATTRDMEIASTLNAAVSKNIYPVIPSTRISNIVVSADNKGRKSGVSSAYPVYTSANINVVTPMEYAPQSVLYDVNPVTQVVGTTTKYTFTLSTVQLGTTTSTTTSASSAFWS